MVTTNVTATASVSPQPAAPVCALRLRISSLGQPSVDAPDVAAVRAEDASGAFGLWPGHEAFLTVLPVGVLSWRLRGAAADAWHYCALRGGVLSVRPDAQGGCVEVATREAVWAPSLAALEDGVLQRLQAHDAAETEARRASRALEVRTLGQLIQLLRPLRVAREGA